ncbi:MAG: P-loop NTPase fold protein [Kiloniellaceae bacterium]
MAALPEDELSESIGGEPRFATPLEWAAESFGFDIADRRNRQRGVESLQNWLGENGFKVPPDGHLGPATLSALDQAYRATQLNETVATVETEAASSDFGMKTAETAAQQAEAAAPPPEPPPTPDDTEASARPVALSDSAICDIDQDRLGFRPYVEAVAEFILAEQTRPPLTLAINAAWGQGKTSFMNMLDQQLKRSARTTRIRVATTWFNPWKYSEPEQVWAAFVANVTRCLRDNLTPEQSWDFRWGRFRQKWHRHADFAFVLHLVVALAFVVLILGVAATMQWSEFGAWSSAADSFLGAFYKAVSASLASSLGYVLIGPFALLALLYAYITFSKKLGLNLLEYVEKTDFKDKIGTLSQFEDEMRRLAEAVPDDLKVIVFIDDLDRCKGKVLGEIIEALQLADVSRACIFVMGMDMRIVANAIETERAELAHSAGRSARMEHGSGYKFLEKIIQARLSLPAHGMAQMGDLVDAAMGREDKPQQPRSGDAGPGAEAAGLGERLRQGIGLAPRSERKAPSDSDALIERARHYGSRHFNNPRRLKRFINSFRLQAYLTAAVRPGSEPIDHLARFLVLTEKWPAVVDHILVNDLPPNFWRHADNQGGTSAGIADEIKRLPNEELLKLVELLEGPGGNDPLEPKAMKVLAAWCGFTYYRGIETKNP